MTMRVPVPPHFQHAGRRSRRRAGHSRKRSLCALSKARSARRETRASVGQVPRRGTASAMRLNFYGFDPSYHIARHRFVQPHAARLDAAAPGPNIASWASSRAERRRTHEQRGPTVPASAAGTAAAARRWRIVETQCRGGLPAVRLTALHINSSSPARVRNTAVRSDSRARSGRASAAPSVSAVARAPPRRAAAARSAPGELAGDSTDSASSRAPPVPTPTSTCRSTCSPG